MNIGIEAQRLLRPAKSGMDVVALEFIRCLQQIDTKNRYFIFVKKDEDEDCLRETGNFRIVRLPSVPYPVWEQFLLPLYVRKYKLDLLHCTANTAPLRGSVPVILTLHDVIFMEKKMMKGSAYQSFGNLYRKLLLPRLIDNKKKITTVSEYEKKNITELLHLPDEAVVVVHNGVSENFRLISDRDLLASVRKKYGLPDRFVLYFGNTAPKKNMVGMLSAYSLYRKSAGTAALPLVITDKSQGEFTRKLLAGIGDPGLVSSLHILPYISYNDLPAVYNLASLYVYPSLRESFGLPLLEAMASGTPVICSDSSCLPEIAGDAAEMVDVTRPEEIAAAMVRLTEDQALRESLIEKGLERVKQFGWRSTAKRFLDLYTAVYDENNRH